MYIFHLVERKKIIRTFCVEGFRSKLDVLYFINCQLQYCYICFAILLPIKKPAPLVFFYVMLLCLICILLFSVDILTCFSMTLHFWCGITSGFLLICTVITSSCFWMWRGEYLDCTPVTTVDPDIYMTAYDQQYYSRMEDRMYAF